MIACNQRVDRMLDVNDGAQVIYMTSIMHKRNKPTRISMQKMIAIAFVGAMFGFAVVASAPAAGAAYTPEQQQACQNDAFRLCEHAIPDEPRVRACMIAKVRQLSPGCRRSHSITRKMSSILLPGGFSQKTCSPRCKPAIVTSAAISLVKHTNSTSRSCVNRRR